jgi:hypothetical protein
MAFTLGGMVGLLWGGIAVDHFGSVALLGGAGALAVVAVVQSIWSVQNQRSRHPGAAKLTPGATSTILSKPPPQLEHESCSRELEARGGSADSTDFAGRDVDGARVA